MRHRGPPVKIAPGPLPFNPALAVMPGYFSKKESNSKNKPKIGNLTWGFKNKP